MLASKLEIWGGVECTVNRVRDQYFDQLAWSGHAARQSDLALFAALGLKCLRQALLWERVAPEGIPDWSWSDEWFAEMRRLQLRPIVGLLHHGSGPRFTSLLDPEFPEKFAAYARSCAERYPWVDAYTPINEPLTTARFSGLYGLWYPHSSNKSDFVRMLLNQIRGSVLAMREIRKINSAAVFLCTEDLAKTSSTPPLKYQANFENERRWLTVDLLAGHVHSKHPMYRYLVDGADKQSVAWFEQNPLPPDILGWNYYVTSERFLDHRIERYPLPTHGGNERHAYADVETVRVADARPTGILELLREAWQRYHLPLAITECHLACTPEEQTRWFGEVFRAAQQARQQEIDIRAVTAWSLLGAYNWQNLLTRDENRYEAGAFDLRSPIPRPTSVAKLVTRLCAGQSPNHPVLDRPGWWRRDSRVQYGAPTRNVTLDRESLCPAAKRILIIGENGFLTQAFLRACEKRELPVEQISLRQVNLSDRSKLKNLLNDIRPWAIINTIKLLLNKQTDLNLALFASPQGQCILAEECEAAGIALMNFSSDEIFDGKKGAAYVESDRPNPATEMGSVYATIEQQVLDAYPTSIMVRTGPLFGTISDITLARELSNKSASGKGFLIPNESVCSPTYVPDLVSAALDLIVDDASGIWHLANRSIGNWADFAYAIAVRADINSALICDPPVSSGGAHNVFSLISERGWLMPNLDDAIGRFIDQSMAITSNPAHDPGVPDEYSALKI